MIALLVVALSVSMAAAQPALIHIDDIPMYNPLDGSTETNTGVLVYDIDYRLIANGGQGTPHTRCITIKTSNTDLHARLVNVTSGVDTGYTTTTNVSDTYTATDPDTYAFKLYVWGGTAGEVSIWDNAGSTWDPMSGGVDLAVGTTGVDIPEFTTIAIPAIALLGLVLYMRRKKD